MQAWIFKNIQNPIFSRWQGKQAVADFDEAALEHDQQQLDRERELATTASPGRSARFTHRQAELDRRQTRGGAHQDQLDQMQTAGDKRQDLLDQQQYEVEHPAPADVASAEQLKAAGVARVDAALKRAAHARRRAHEAFQRAEAAERRALATQERDGPPT